MQKTLHAYLLLAGFSLLSCGATREEFDPTIDILEVEALARIPLVQLKEGLFLPEHASYGIRFSLISGPIYCQVHDVSLAGDLRENMEAEPPSPPTYYLCYYRTSDASR